MKPEKGLEGDTREERVKAKGGGENGKSANGTKLSSSSSSSSSLATLGRLLPLLKEKRERERGERRMCRMQFHRDDVCEDACCFPRGCVLSLLLPFHKETIFVAGARG